MTESGNQTAAVSRQLVIVRTSQNGITSERIGKILPAGRAQGVDIQSGDLAQSQDRGADPPQATGAVLAIKQSKAASNG